MVPSQFSRMVWPWSCGDGFGVELEAVDGAGDVADGHDVAIIGGGIGAQRLWHGGGEHGEGVVADHVEALGQAVEQALSIGADGGDLAVADFLGGDDASAERLADGLVAEADAPGWAGRRGRAGPRPCRCRPHWGCRGRARGGCRLRLGRGPLRW